MAIRLQGLKRALTKRGIEVVTPASGSHWKAVGNGISYPIPAHNGLKTELADVYIKGLCRTFGLDEVALRADC